MSNCNTSLDHARAWLEHFPEDQRATIANWFHAAVRSGASRPDAVLLAVTREVRRRLASLGDAARRAPFAHVLTEITTSPHEARAYAASVLAWERLPQPERDRLKAARSREYQRAYMRTQPPTDKQRALLLSLGYRGAPPTDRLAASEIIDHLLTRKGRP